MSQYQFTPSSNDLLAMIANAESKFDSDREQLELKRDAQDCARMENMMTAQVAQRNRNFWNKK